jgi:hypothetical protein
MRELFNRISSSAAPAETVLVRLLVGGVFLTEGIQKFLYPEALGAGRFAKIGIPAPAFIAPFVGVVDHTIIVGVGGATELELADRSLHPGANLMVEWDAIENWLELEIGASVLSANRGVEAPIDLLIKKPFKLAPWAEFMFALAPRWSSSRTQPRRRRTLAERSRSTSCFGRGVVASDFGSSPSTTSSLTPGRRAGSERRAGCCSGGRRRLDGHDIERFGGAGGSGGHNGGWQVMNLAVVEAGRVFEGLVERC